MNIGNEILDAIEDGNLLLEVCLHEDGTSSLIWAANAAEQLEALVCDKIGVLPTFEP